MAGLAAAQADVVPARLEGRFLYATGYQSRTLDLRRDGRFELVDGGCVAEDRYVGRATLEGTDLVLRSEAATDIRYEKPTKPDNRVFGPFVPVQWDERLYLVDRAEAVAFCDSVNAGTEPRFQAWERFNPVLLRDQDWMKEAGGDPDVPAEWKERLLPGPIVGRIVSVGPDGRAMLDLGATDGVQRGMYLTRHFQPAQDWAVPQGQPWMFSPLVVVGDVSEETCSLPSNDAHFPPRVGQLVTGRVPRSLPLPLSMWRTAGEDRRLSFAPLSPLPGISRADLDRWTAQIKSTLSPGIPLEPAPSAALVDALTPAFLNALRGLDMGQSADVAKAEAILASWKGYRSLCGEDRDIRIDFEGSDYVRWRLAPENRIWQLETFVMWWREMSSDRARFANFQRASQP